MALWSVTGKQDLLENGANSDLRMLLVDPDHIPSDSYEFVSSVVGDEVSGAGYLRADLGITVVLDQTNKVTRIAGDEVVFTAADFGSAGGAWIYRHVSADSTHKLWCFLELIPIIVTNGANVTLRFSSRGIAAL